MITSMFYQLPTNWQSLLLNAITGVSCIQSVFPHCKLQQAKVTNKQYRNL